MALRNINSLDLQGKRALVRVDFNVPLHEGKVGDATRIEAALPTIRLLLDSDAAVILCSHLGRPKGQRDEVLSLRPVAGYLAGLIGQGVEFVDDCVGDEVERRVSELEPGSILLLENLRFHPGEEHNDPDFAAGLAKLVDCYVNDAFGAAHRAHASTEGVARLLPSAAGLLMKREISALNRVLDDPEPPLVLIIGGAKVSDKIDVIDAFVGRASAIVIGGGMANTFLEATGHEIGSSLSETELKDTALELLRRANEAGTEMLLPVDAAVSVSLSDGETSAIVNVDDVPVNQSIFDIGPNSVRAFRQVIETARTLVWNGPMGVFEHKPFDQGTLGVASAVADSSAYSLVGGGDSVAALNAVGLADAIDHVSTGGGASLEYLEGKKLPGIAVLEVGDE